MEYCFTKALFPRDVGPETGPAVWAMEDTFTADVQVVGPEAPDELRLPDDPSLAEAIKQAIVVKGAYYGDISPTEGKALQIVFEIADDLPVAVAFEVVGQVGGREIVLGLLDQGLPPRRAMPPGVLDGFLEETAEQSYARQVVVQAVADDLRTTQVTPILRTACRFTSFTGPGYAGHEQGRTCFEVWKGELRYDPVNIQMVSSLRRQR